MHYPKTLSLLWMVLAFAAGTPSSVTAQEKTAPKKAPARSPMLRHIVCFKFKPEITDKQIASMEKAFAGLKKKIPGIVAFEHGENNSPEGLNKGFQRAYIVTFDSEESRAAYLPHPEHLKFVEIIKPMVDDVFVIDFWKK